MCGPSKSLPKYRKHKASGQAVVNLSGVDRYLGPHGTKANKLEYDRLVAEWLARGRMAELQSLLKREQYQVDSQTGSVFSGVALALQRMAAF